MSGQADVEDDEAGPVVPYRVERADPGALLQHPEALPDEVERDEVGDVGLVLDDEDRPLLHALTVPSHSQAPMMPV